MALIALRDFGGEVPKLPAHLLPDNAAQLAADCDLSRGSLGSLVQGQFIASMSVNPVRALYTEEGTKFLVWDIDTQPVKGPVVADTNKRVYYLEGQRLRVTSYLGATPTGARPGLTTDAWLVGVPKPVDDPGLTVVERNSLADYPSAVLQLWAGYDNDGTRYDYAQVSLATVSAWREYTFTAPARGAGTPAEAVLFAELRATENGKILFTVSTTTAATVPVRNTSLPGGFELLLSNVSGTTYKLRLDWGVAETRAYVYTHVNVWQEESAPSGATIISVTYMQDVQVTVGQLSFFGYIPFSKYNIYRTFGTNPAYLRITKNTEQGTVFLDSARSVADAGPALPSLSWDPPPLLPNALARSPNGWLAMAVGNDLYMSEPYHPHAWPYSITFPKAVRGIAVTTQAMVVTTADGCYLISGPHPKSVSELKLPLPQAGLVQSAMTEVEGAVAFASHDGIVFVSGSNASMQASQALFTRDEWRSRYGDLFPKTLVEFDGAMQFTHYDGTLLMVSRDTSTRSVPALGFLLRTDDRPSFVRFNNKFDALCQLPTEDALYYTQGANVFKFRAGDTLASFDWWSKEFIFPRYETFAAAYIRCMGAVTVSLYVDGNTSAAFYTFNASNEAGSYHRLPPGRYLRWSFRFSGTGAVWEAIFGSSMDELKNA